MKILHTADWHLGKKLEQFERAEEHQDFLDWLILKLDELAIDVLIVAGDIFDTGTPSNTALQQYYRFLRRVKNTTCSDVIIVGGNHDSISTLNAPKELLKFFNVHIVGGVPDECSEQVIPILGTSGEVELVVCAVPFLRDKDIRLSVSGETMQEREERIKKGIADHYRNLVQHITVHKANNIPIIATGHLFAAGSSSSESEKEIHIGNLGQVRGDQFPQEFNYIALGHLHRPQVVNQLEHVRYSGSPIPLSFSENDDLKQVVIVEFEKGKLIRIEEQEVPCYRKLIRIKGGLESVKSQILLLNDPKTKYPAWVELQIDTDSYITDLAEQLEIFRKNRIFIGQFFVRQVKLKQSLTLDQLAAESFTLVDLDPKTVFLKKCSEEFGDNDISELTATFEQALELLYQQRGES